MSVRRVFGFKEIMALISIMYTFAYMTALTFFPPESDAGQRFGDLILGSLLTIVLGKIFSEFFGKDKDEDEPQYVLLAYDVYVKEGLKYILKDGVYTLITEVQWKKILKDNTK